MAIKAKSLGSAGSAVQTLLITGGTNATPIVATFAANSGLKTGDRVAIAGITGLTAMNGIWTLEAVTSTTFKLLGSVGNGTYGGTPRCAQVFDQTPLHAGHAAKLSMQGNLVGTITLTAFASLAEFTANDNSLLGTVVAPVQSSAVQGVTNTNATSASSSTKATSALVMAATNAASQYEIKLPYILHGEITAYTSGTGSMSVAG
jgi:hypothetical protein